VGSIVAIQAAAEAPARYHAYIGMAQMVHQLESEKLAYDYTPAEHRRRGDLGMVRELEMAPVTMTGGTPGRYLEVRDKAMHRSTNSTGSAHRSRASTGLTTQHTVRFSKSRRGPGRSCGPTSLPAVARPVGPVPPPTLTGVD
jgi:hypothetical protein